MDIELAKQALADGWSKELLLRIRDLAQGRPCRYLGWGILIDGRYIAYKNHSLDRLILYMHHRPNNVPIVCYTDGSGTTKDKPAGSGAAVYEPELYLAAANVGNGTNNFGELSAVWLALKSIPDITRTIHIFSDSEYSIGALTKDWARNHNAELIGMVREDMELRSPNVTLQHVAGHSGVVGNEIADWLCNIGRKFMK